MRGAMDNTLTPLHFVDPDSRLRAELARTALALGHHAEVYADLDELLEHRPASGIVVIRQATGTGVVAKAIDRLVRSGVWLPIIAIGNDPGVGDVVAAIKAGALDYLSLPLEENALRHSLRRVAQEVEAHTQSRRRMIEARGRIASLSQREREVLDWLAEGSSNKTIARELSISPRTVEIHRANMMTKLGANHAAEAVRLRLEAELKTG